MCASFFIGIDNIVVIIRLLQSILYSGGDTDKKLEAYTINKKGDIRKMVVTH